MQTNKKTTPLFSSIRIHLLTESDKVKAMASCLVSGAIMVTGIRVIEGQNGLFVSMPQRKHNTTGEYTDVAFPISKEVRDEMSLQILGEFSRVAHSGELATAA